MATSWLNLEGKTVVVTGGASGIGKAVAQEFLQNGANVVVCDINPTKPEFEPGAGKYEYVVTDVTSRESVENMVEKAKEAFGKIDVLVNNAGITKDGLIARMSEEQFDMVASVNYKGVFNMIRHVTPVMMKQRSGRIVNVTSVAGLYGNPGQMNYSASKAGVVGMTLTAAKELGPRNITVNAVAPGFIETPMTEVLGEEYKEQIKSQIPLRRFGQPEEIAGAVSFLVSDDASFITAQVIVIDGGMAM